MFKTKFEAMSSNSNEFVTEKKTFVQNVSTYKSNLLERQDKELQYETF